MNFNSKQNFRFCNNKQQYEIPEALKKKIQNRARHMIISFTLVVFGGVLLAGKYTYQKFYPKETQKFNETQIVNENQKIIEDKQISQEQPKQ
ncbi:unnamed protein product [Paramecium primaurelia]|uniref:Uncharacterized protein n=1 Tax=Paramecium primaurelia TaxID=5886 RepID=A0A8S1L6K0_PARPR|nr:unnamed protein product [Paramecium primaurelia]